MPSTTNFSWTTPADTDLVKDGALAIRTLGNGIDTSLVDLKGGTTGQILSKASNTDLDYSWIANPASVVNAKGDILTATADDTLARLAVGANDLLLTAASGETTGLKYTGGWTSFTPSWTNLTVGNGTLTAAYCQIGKVVHVRVRFVLGSTSAISGNITMSHPVGTSVTDAGNQNNVTLLDQGTAFFVGVINININNITVGAHRVDATYTTLSNTSATVPFTWANSDAVIFSYWYEVA